MINAFLRTCGSVFPRGNLGKSHAAFRLEVCSRVEERRGGLGQTASLRFLSHRVARGGRPPPGEEPAEERCPELVRDGEEVGTAAVGRGADGSAPAGKE